MRNNPGGASFSLHLSLNRQIVISGGSSGAVWAGNNVIAETVGSPAVDLGLCAGNDHIFSHNHYTSNDNPPGISVARSSGEPGFIAPGVPFPRNASVLRNSGTLAVPGDPPAFDLSFVSRPQGGRIDRGAYEITELFAHGFE